MMGNPGGVRARGLCVLLARQRAGLGFGGGGYGSMCVGMCADGLLGRVCSSRRCKSVFSRCPLPGAGKGDTFPNGNFLPMTSPTKGALGSTFPSCSAGAGSSPCSLGQSGRVGTTSAGASGHLHVSS